MEVSMFKCIVCNGENPKFALSLKKEKGEWTVKPICGKCRHTLEKEARKEKKYIPFFKLETSLAEVARRNLEAKKFRPFIEAFALERKKNQKLLR
jgi:hypothetical protein